MGGNNGYYETIKKWLGAITFTLTETVGNPTAYTINFNYGFSKYEDFGNQDFTVNDIECVGLAGAADTGFNLRLYHHNSTGWTYASTGFVPGGTSLGDMNTDHSTEQNVANGSPFAWKRVDLNTDINGDNGEGLVLEITTAANRAIESMDVHIGVHTIPKYFYLADATQHALFMKHGSNFHQV